MHCVRARKHKFTHTRSRKQTDFALGNAGFPIAKRRGYGEAALFAYAHPQEPHLSTQASTRNDMGQPIM
jgi:hypothetical protein